MVKKIYSVTLEESEVREALDIYDDLFDSKNLSSFVNRLITKWLKAQNSPEGVKKRTEILEKKLEELKRRREE
jgi:predicted DNA-binding ribbon-helix-helix protein